MNSELLFDKEAPKYPVIIKVIEVASEAFYNYGIKTITMDEIASSAAISKRTLYQLFKDKEELLLACILHSQMDMEEHIKDLLSQTSSVLEIILHIYKYLIRQYHNIDKRFFEDIHRYPSVYKIFLRGQERDSSDVVNFFRSGVEQGLFRSDVNFEIVNFLLREQFNIFLDSNIYLKYTFVDIYESLMFTYLRGISTDKGVRELELFLQEYRKD
ncbi:TetR/AcrR family transcriptional regulator [Bacteroides propionicifaciens]|uniref:TetR/AcrR family transcriptional regulator n=1 Tax=Bacteroides propionicifaciens TaxID=392838 RepID=UPI000363FCC1|nr:TetR/AcrR family transcriptional regulator [Bacteroides propionicifaciens]